MKTGCCILAILCLVLALVSGMFGYGPFDLSTGLSFFLRISMWALIVLSILLVVGTFLEGAHADDHRAIAP